MRTPSIVSSLLAAGAISLACLAIVRADRASAGDVERAKDPGVRAGPATSDPLPSLTPNELQLFNLGKAEFAEAETVADGLGPAMNLDNCAGCHASPSVGGTSSAQNPQIGLAKFTHGKAPALPSFVSPEGPVRVARFVKKPDGTPDGTVHPLLTVSYRPDGQSCLLQPPDFAKEMANHNVIFRIPTPVFGAGLIQQIPDSTILANQAANAASNKALGITGKPNRIPPIEVAYTEKTAKNDYPIGRFGWKAHNSSLLVAGAEAYSQEMGISNEMYRIDQGEGPTCPYVTNARDGEGADSLPPIDVVRRYRNTMGHRYPLTIDELRRRLAAFAERNPPGRHELADMNDPELVDSASSVERFAIFMSFLAPPRPSSDSPGGAASISRGKALFATSGCAACHTPSLETGNAREQVLRNRPVNLYSDLLLHDMGPGLADGIRQADAGPRDFRTAPLWGLGQRLYFLHDGRTSDLLVAIKSHQSGSREGGDASEANAVIDKFNALSEASKQDLLNFMRSL
jgi:CxxC motif-containing protein (DUF1111 family)